MIIGRRAEVSMRWLGRLDYAEALAAQRAHRDGLVDGVGEEELWLLEHPPTVTLGRRGGEVDRGALAAGGVPVVETERGGLATWHGPGQLVGYPLVRLEPRRWRVRDVVGGIERGLVAWLVARDIRAATRPGLHGVWVGEQKIASVGMHVRRGVTMHGFSLNLDLPDGAFAGMVPCGLSDVAVTSVAGCGGGRYGAEAVALSVGEAVLSAIVRAHDVDG